MTMLKKGIKNLQAIDAKIVFGSPKLRATHIGDKLGTVVQKDGARTRIKMKNVKVAPDLFCNLFCIAAALNEQCSLKGSEKRQIIKKGERRLCFDYKIKSGT